MDPFVKTPSSSPVTPQSTSFCDRTPVYNPYQRTASRRAIACVTCAKAKTKCDKALPSCSRCIAKGIKCDPRSTRRTSENNYRANIKKPFVSPKPYNHTNKSPSLDCYSSSRTILSSRKARSVRAASDVDFRTAVKMSQQASACSGFPSLTPLSTYAAPATGQCYPYHNNSDQDMAGCRAGMDTNQVPDSGCLTPQTPESSIYHEPLTMGDMTSAWMATQPWLNDSLASGGLDLEGDVNGQFSAEFWSASKYAHNTPIAQLPWVHSALSPSTESISSELMSYAGAAPSLSTSEGLGENLNNSGLYHDDWSKYQHTTTHFNTTNMTTSAPFMHDILSVPSLAPAWEDVFMPGSAPY